MILTADKFEQIVASLKSYGTTSRSAEKRAAPRVGLRMQIAIVPHTPGEPAKQQFVWLRDISVGGMGFLNSRPMTVGTFLLVCLPKGQKDTLTILYRVVRCVPISDKQFVIGVKLERVIGRK
jgi:hypothetical protein